MTVHLSLLGLAVNTPLAVPTSRAYRPPSWPPPKDWVCIEDKNGNPVSRYGDPIWDITPWCGNTFTFDFGDGPKKHARSPAIDPENAELLRQLVAWKVWGPRGGRSAMSIFKGYAHPFRKIIKVCSDNGILASDLWRYPAVIDQVAQTLGRANYDNIVAELDRLRDARAHLGFELLDSAGIARLKAAQPEHTPEQTEYIPPRIWAYVVNRVADCINDYRAHQEQIEACFAFCVHAYETNGAIKHRERGGGTTRNPFLKAPPGRTGVRAGITYHGCFSETAQEFGIKNLLERWAGKIEGRHSVLRFSSYLSIVQWMALIDIAAFTLMRVEEAASVRWNCLRWDSDPVFGRIPLIQAETTKTDPDEEGLWITSPSIEPAIHTLRTIAKLRLSYAARWSEECLLLTAPLEPWGLGRKTTKQEGVQPRTPNLGEFICKFPHLFDLQQLTITPEDYKIAKAVCPSLNAEQFKVGTPWHLAWHQFRRTGAVNMFASGEISDSSIQLQMKHLSRFMSLYYGRGNSTLRLNDKARQLLVNAQYEAMSRQLAEVHSERFISPYGEEHKAKLLASANGGEPVNLLDTADVRAYEAAARKQQITFKQTALGACLRTTPCNGDCISSIGDCAGGNGKSPCATILFDRNRAEANQIRLDGVMGLLAVTPPETPRYRFLEQEKRGLENYFAYIRRET